MYQQRLPNGSLRVQLQQLTCFLYLRQQLLLESQSGLLCLILQPGCLLQDPCLLQGKDGTAYRLGKPERVGRFQMRNPQDKLRCLWRVPSPSKDIG